jgi:hypothetical protein
MCYKSIDCNDAMEPKINRKVGKCHLAVWQVPTGTGLYKLLPNPIQPLAGIAMAAFSASSAANFRVGCSGCWRAGRGSLRCLSIASTVAERRFFIGVRRGSEADSEPAIAGAERG